MALTYNALVELIKRESQAHSLRSLSELTAHEQSIGVASTRTLLINLFSLRLLFSLGGAAKAADLCAALSLLLERYQYGEISRGRAVLDLSNRVFSRLLETATNLETTSHVSARIGARLRSIRTADLEEELTRMLNLDEFPRITSSVNLASPAAYRQSLLPYAERGHGDRCFVTLAAMDLLQFGERLPELLPILGSLAERGLLLAGGLFDLEGRRRATALTTAPRSSVAFLLFKTEEPWEPSGAFSRLPALKVATLNDPVRDGWRPDARMPHLDREIVERALAGEAVDAGQSAPEQSTALVAVGGTDIIPFGEEGGGVEKARAAGSARAPRERRTTIGFKLIFITSIILVVTLSAMIVVASIFFSNDITVRIEENDHTLAQVTALAVQREFQGIVSQTRLFLNMVSQFRAVPNAAQALETAFFAETRGIAYVGIPGGQGFYNQPLLDGRQLRHRDLMRAIETEKSALDAVQSGTVSVVNLSSLVKSPALAIVVPLRRGAGELPLVIVTTLDPFVHAVQTTGITQTFVVNAHGQLIIAPNLTLLGGNIDYSRLPIVAAMLNSPLNNGELQYGDANGVRYIGAFERSSFAGIGAVAAAPTSLAFAAVRAIDLRNFYLMVVVLALAILVVYYFSKTITRPVRKLVDAARQVEVGNFLLELRPSTRDELGILTETFVQMGRGLHERERIKDAFGKFVSKSIAEQVMQEEVRLGGERKFATIFFSDIRSFTAISENLQPEEVVEFLNEYMTRMVECVNETGGVVDKFIGDAIMAVWGLPVSRGNDAEHAIDGALMMRAALREFNRGRGTASRPLIRIGCGINSGPVVAGQIGSTERMEYTVIGDPVNLASRIEALNKPFGTDILISSDTYELVKEIFEVVPQLKIKVKGKSEPQQIFAVLGRKDDLHRPKTLRELQRLIGVDPAKLKKSKGLEEEVKYEILDD